MNAVLTHQQKIQRWFRYHGQKTLTGEKVDAVEKVLREFTAQSKPPRRVPVVQFYQRQHYNSRIKATVDHDFHEGCAAAKRNGTTPPTRLAVLNLTAQRLYDAESDEFKQDLLQRLEADHAAAMAAYEKSTTATTNTPSTPEDFDK